MMFVNYCNEINVRQKDAEWNLYKHNYNSNVIDNFKQRNYVKQLGTIACNSDHID